MLDTPGGNLEHRDRRPVEAPPGAQRLGIQLPVVSPATVPVQHARRLSFEGAPEAVLAGDE